MDSGGTCGHGTLQDHLGRQMLIRCMPLARKSCLDLGRKTLCGSASRIFKGFLWEKVSLEKICYWRFSDGNANPRELCNVWGGGPQCCHKNQYDGESKIL